MPYSRMARSRGPLVRAGLTAVVLLVTSALAGCGSVPVEQTTDPLPSTSSSPSPTESPTPTVSPKAEPDPADAPDVSLTASVDNGATNVGVDTVVKANAKSGTLSKVSLSYKGLDSFGKAKTITVDGKLNSEKTEWTAVEGLDPDADYRLVITGKNAGSESATRKARFSTEHLELSQQTFPELYPADGSEVGVGMPVILLFDIGIEDKAEFERHLSVTSSPQQEGSWHWVSDKEVHFRPKEFWKKDTLVSVDANLNGVNAGDGIYGQHSRSASFTVGRSVITKINLKTKKATVTIDGLVKKTIPVSGGGPGYSTRSGTKLISEKHTNYRMTSEMIGLPKTGPESYDLMAAYAMRITNSGEFVHSAPWNAGYFGKTNASHGCVGMSVADSGWLFKRVLIGSPVITTGTKRTLEQGNGWADWDISFAEYAKGSAL